MSIVSQYKSNMLFLIREECDASTTYQNKKHTTKANKRIIRDSIKRRPQNAISKSIPKLNVTERERERRGNESKERETKRREYTVK